MKTVGIFFVVLVPAAMLAAQAAPRAAPKPPAAVPATVAILDYEAESPGNPRLGTQMADILTARLSVEEWLQLVERAKLGKVIDEQKLKLVGLVDQNQAVKVGKLVGAKLLVMGKAFVMDKKLMIVTKIVGVETGRVVGTLRQVDLSKPLSGAIMLLGEDIAKLIRKKVRLLLPKKTKLADPLAEIRAKWGKRPRPCVAVVVPESHRTRIVTDPAVETEIKRTLIACGVKVVDIGKNDLADWAKGMFKDKSKPWPPALVDADLVIVGEAFSEFALRTGELVTCAARAEINLIDRHTGRILLADRQTARAVDLAEVIAGKTALQIAGRRLAVAVCRKLLAYKPPAGRAAPAKKPGKVKESGDSRQNGSLPAMRAFALTDYHSLMELPIGPRTRTAAATRSVRRTIFAAPFENVTGQRQYEPAAAGLGDLVAVLLAQQENVVVVERHRLAALTAEQARALKGLTGQTYALRAGKLFKADTVLTGRLFLLKGKLTVNVKALDIATARVAAADELSCRPEYLPEAALQMARRLGKQMALPLPKIDLKKIDKSPIASLHFAQALSHYYAGNADAAIMQFMRTLDLDPNYAEVHYWSGMCYHKLGEDAHAIIEWEKFLKDRGNSKYAKQVRRLLAEAKAREKQSPVERLAPTTKSSARKT